MKHLLFYLFLLIGLGGMARSPESEANIPLNGNAYITSVERQARITDPGRIQSSVCFLRYRFHVIKQ